MSVFQSEVENADTVAGSKLAIVTTRLSAGVNLKIVESVRTVTTPGATIDVVVMEAPWRQGLYEGRLLAYCMLASRL